MLIQTDLDTSDELVAEHVNYFALFFLDSVAGEYPILNCFLCFVLDYSDALAFTIYEFEAVEDPEGSVLLPHEIYTLDSELFVSELVKF